MGMVRHVLKGIANLTRLFFRNDIMTITSCNICGNESGRLVLRRDKYEVVRCDGCGLVFVNGRFSDEEMRGWYAEGYYTGQWDQVYKDYIGQRDRRVASFRNRVGLLRKYVNAGRLLEVGCAAGFFLEAAKENFEVQGVELSEYSSRYARDALGHCVHTGTLASAGLAAESFDVAVLWDVIEHVTDPRTTLAEVRRVLKPGGVLALSTGDIGSLKARCNLKGWGLMAPPWHLYYYSKRTIRRLLADVGFEVAHLETNSVYTYSTSPFWNNRLLRSLTYRLRLGDIMTLVCRWAKDRRKDNAPT